MLITPRDFVGKIVKVKFSYYNNKTGRMDVKARPFLVIRNEADSFPCDFNGLPVSSVSYTHNLDHHYDLKIALCAYPDTNLTRPVSYIRIHKIQTFHSSEVDRLPISSLKDAYPDLYAEITALFDQFCKSCF